MNTLRTMIKESVPWIIVLVAIALAVVVIATNDDDGADRQESEQPEEVDREKQ